MSTPRSNRSNGPSRPLRGWHYDEFAQVGIDFENAEQVAAYDRDQGSDPAAETALIEQLGIRAGHVVVDLGCGTASFATAAARGGAVVHAVDVSAAMLDAARRAADARGVTGMRFHRAGFLSFDPEPASIDFVVTRFALHHLPDFWKQVALMRVHQMLRPGGTLFLRDVCFSFDAADWERGIDAWVERMPRESGFAREDFETHVR